jgi:seryl-tRNA synthetase
VNNLSRSFKAAKNSIKETHSLLDSLGDMVRNDFKKNFSGLEESLNQRIDEAEKAILESSKAREAMVAGVGSMKKSIEKAQRKFSKSNNLDELRLTLTEIFEDIDRLKLANDKISDDISLVLHPNMSAVESIERFASDLQRFAGTWERLARDIDQSITDLCDDQDPSELIDLEQYISNQGFDKLVGRSVKSVESE